ncbi:hypothetical protein OB13_01205 [Pontibacter sp. HJ8]
MRWPIPLLSNLQLFSQALKSLWLKIDNTILGFTKGEELFTELLFLIYFCLTYCKIQAARLKEFIR